MALAGQHTAYQREWGTHPIEEDFMGSPISSGNFLSGTPVVVPSMWMTGPSVGNTQCSGVIAQCLSGALGGQVQLLAPGTAGAEGTLFTQNQNFAMVSGGSLYGRFRARLDEVTTSGALACQFGFASAPFQSGLTLTNGARTSGNCFSVGKTSGQQNFAMIANVQTSGLVVQCTQNFGGNQSGQFYDIELFLNPDRGNVQFTAKVNGVPLKQAGLTPINYTQPAMLQFPVDSTPMSLFAGIKEGAGEVAGVTLDKAYGQVGTIFP